MKNNPYALVLKLSRKAKLNLLILDKNLLILDKKLDQINSSNYFEKVNNLCKAIKCSMNALSIWFDAWNKTADKLKESENEKIKLT